MTGCYLHDRGNGTIRVTVRLKVDGTKIVTSTTYKCDSRLSTEENHEEATKLGAYFMREVEQEYWDEKEKRNPTFRDFFNEVYLKEGKTRIADTTFELYVNTVEKHFFGTFGDLKLNDITRSLLQKKIDHFVDDKDEDAEDPVCIKGQTIKRYVSAFRAVINLAVEQGLLADEPFGDMCYPKIYRPIIKCMDQDDYKELLSYLYKKLTSAPNELNRTDVIIAIAVMAGLRRGEIVALQWGDIENLVEDRLDRCQICVNASAYKVKGKPQQRGKPKSVASQRAFVIPELLARILYQWKKESEKRGQVSSTDFVFPGQSDGMVNVSSATKWVRQFFEQSKWPKVKLHSLRHTFASVLYYTKQNRETIKRVMGHEDFATTDLYLYSFEARDKDLMENVNAFHADLLKEEEETK